MTDFILGKIVKVKADCDSVGNIYQVVNNDETFVQLQCLEYFGPEDLGHNISIYGYGQTVWISKFFNYLFEDGNK